MKNIIKFIFIVLIGGVMVTSCGERDYGWTDFSIDEVANNGKVFLSFQNRNYFLDYLDADGIPANEVIELWVRVIGPPPTEDINVTFAVVEPSTAVAGIHFTTSAPYFTIMAGELSGPLTFVLAEEAFTPGEIETLFIELTGTSSTSYTLHNVGTSTRYQFMQNCVLNIFIFDGQYDLYLDDELDGEITVSNNPQTSNVTAAPIWTGNCSVNLTFHSDGTLTGENQLTGGDFGPPFGLVEFEDINDGKVLNSCNGAFQFRATPTLTGGYWWGGEFLFEVLEQGNGKKKVEIIGAPEGFDINKPIKRE